MKISHHAKKKYCRSQPVVLRSLSLIVVSAMMSLGGASAFAQTAPPESPAPAHGDRGEQEAKTPADASSSPVSAPKVSPSVSSVPVVPPAGPVVLPAGPVVSPKRDLVVPARVHPLQRVELRVHVISTGNVYSDLKFDVFSVSSQDVVGRGEGANEAIGESVESFVLNPGLYKIVKAGEAFETSMDFATVTLERDTDFLIVVDADNGGFRGAGVVTGELPEGLDIAGIRLALNVGGTLWMNQKRGVVGDTNGLSALVGMFGNFGMVYDEGPNFLTVDAKLQLNLQDAPTSGIFASADYLEASALYAYNINNPYVGPYARAGLKTSVFPGYLYLADDNARIGDVSINRLDGTRETHVFGNQANPDDLRLEVSRPLAPLILQEELGANLKAVDVDLKLLELSVATRVGWGFRQGLTGGLLVVKGSEKGRMVELDEVANYATHGPVLGASANLTFARWLFGQAEVAALVPLQDASLAGSSRGAQLLIDASGTAGLKFPAFTSFLHASFDYTFRLQKDGFITSKTMIDQIVMARMSVQLF